MLSQFEIGAGFVPGGGPMARLPRLMGRGRALEVLMTGSYLNGELAERYGYVNRALPDAELMRSATRWPGESPDSTSGPSRTSSGWSTPAACPATIC